MCGIKLRHLLTFSTGLLLGAVAVIVPVANYYNGMLEGWYVAGVVQQAWTARDIRAGRTEQLVEGIEASLPDYVAGVKALFGVDAAALPALWAVKEYYHETGTPVPQELAPILSNLPPKPPGCCKRARLQPPSG